MNVNVLPLPLEESTLTIHLDVLGLILSDATVTEIVINRPGRALVEHQGGRWVECELPALTYTWCIELAKLLQNYSSQIISEASPLLGAHLPDGQRVQIVQPPAVPDGTVSITIRCPSTRVLTLDELVAGGAFCQTRGQQSALLLDAERTRLEADLCTDDQAMLEMFRAGDWPAFFHAAVGRRKNIIASGATGSGKTTLAVAFAAMIGHDERIITVEDVAEMRLGGHVVNMFYPKGKGVSKAGARELLEATLRMRPDRVLLAELRGDEAFFFIQNVLNSGHPGTITTVHATRAKGVFRRLGLMIKASPEGAGIGLPEIFDTLYMLVDVIAQMDRLPDGQRVVSEVYFDPAFAAKQLG
jgi:type IV secretion system protein VirB11